MQSSLQQRQSSQGLARRNGSSRQRVAFAPARQNRALSVQVFAKKGKGRGVIRQSAGVAGQPGMVGPGGAQQMSVQDAKVPPVDPEQAEFVMFVKAKNVTVGKLSFQETPWYPLSIMKAGQTGTTLVSFMQNEWGRKLYSNLLIRQLGQSIYKEKESLASNIRKNYPPLANVATKDLTYGFKVRDKTKPEDWKVAENLTVIPPENVVAGNPLDNIKAFFSVENLSSMFKN